MSKAADKAHISSYTRGNGSVYWDSSLKDGKKRNITTYGGRKLLSTAGGTDTETGVRRLVVNFWKR
ncbi:MAG: hypothetical protein LBF80_00680 [Spirochaetaceae bacterium]|jgi:hypothetical protein|nr:hypothetical protein [Spirochaetaceae bacterium]